MKQNYQEEKLPKIPNLAKATTNIHEICERLYSLIDAFDKSLSYNQGFKDCVYMLKIALGGLYITNQAKENKKLKEEISALKQNHNIQVEYLSKENAWYSKWLGLKLENQRNIDTIQRHKARIKELELQCESLNRLDLMNNC